LYNHAYTAANVEETLHVRTLSFVNDKKYNNISKDKINVSKIFDWYGVDFGDLKTFLGDYSEEKFKKTASVTFQEYNWDLNE
jgi:hypothetical protein